MTLVSAPTSLSPCIGVCKLDESTGYCLGCGRTGEEIGAWAGLGPAGRDAIWAELPVRLAAMSVPVRLLPLAGCDLVRWVANTLHQETGAWTIGVPGTAAFFTCPARDVQIADDGGKVVAAKDGMRFRLRVAETLRAFALKGDEAVVFALPKRAALPLPVTRTLTALGKDGDAIAPEERSHALFDLGLGRPSHRILLRVSDPASVERLTSLEGRPWANVSAELGADFWKRAPVAIAESSLARIEMESETPPAEGSQAAELTDFSLPDRLEHGSVMRDGLNLPEYALPQAIFRLGRWATKKPV